MIPLILFLKKSFEFLFVIFCYAIQRCCVCAFVTIAFAVFFYITHHRVVLNQEDQKVWKDVASLWASAVWNFAKKLKFEFKPGSRFLKRGRKRRKREKLEKFREFLLTPPLALAPPPFCNWPQLQWQPFCGNTQFQHSKSAHKHNEAGNTCFLKSLVVSFWHDTATTELLKTAALQLPHGDLNCYLRANFFIIF